MPYAFGNIYFKDDLVIGIEEKPDIVTYALAGIYVMKPSLLDLVPYNEFFGMDTLIKKMLTEQKPISKYELKEYWLDIGRVNDFETAQKEFHENFYKVSK